MAERLKTRDISQFTIQQIPMSATKISAMRPSSTPSAAVTAAATSSSTVTVETPSRKRQPETLTLRLKRKEKKVTWKEGTVDNEFMQKKSCKKCCIFHKEKSFDEDYSDDDDDHHNHDCEHDHKSDGACSSKDNGGADLNSGAD